MVCAEKTRAGIMTPTARYPEPNVIRFVRRFFPKPGRVLDIGSGSGNHARFFEDEGWTVTALDPDLGCRTHSYVDIESWLFHYRDKRYDLILDHNTLCHVENPLYKQIHDALTPTGMFLCVHPTDKTWPGIANGRFTRFASKDQLIDLLSPFRDVTFAPEPACHPDYRGHSLKSWVAWGWK
jgi:SAM-dependent methyltransferase